LLKELKEKSNRKRNYMMSNQDSLKVNRNEDGSFTCEWDRNDPKWKWLNDLTSQQLEVIIDQAMKENPYVE
tara:strand:+ start:1105 stop:1317 length:213 start_codon:yes stop_codon:yes gene_type:complete